MSTAVPVTESESDMNCGLCEKKQQKTRPAVCYCNDCDVLLCKLCYENHLFQRELRSHKLLRGEDMIAMHRSSIRPEMGCQAHHGYLLDRYCKFHDTPVCQQCLNGIHNRCKDIRDLRDAAADVMDDYPRTVDGVKDLFHYMTELKKKHENTRVNIGHHRDIAIRQIKLLREEMEDILEKLEKDMIDEVEITYKAEYTVITGHIGKCAAAIPALEILLRSLEKAKQTHLKARMYLAAKRASFDTQRFRQITVDAKAHLINTSIKFVPNDRFFQTVRKMDKFGTVKVEKSHVNPTNNNSITDDLEDESPPKSNLLPVASNFLKVRFTGKHSVRFADDQYNCYIVGIAIAPNGHILLVDKANGRLKKLDQNLFRLSALDLPSRPYAIAVIDEGQAVVALPQVKQIQFITVRQTLLTLGRTVRMQARFNTVAYSEQKLIVCCSSLIQVTDLNGTVLKSISVKEESETPSVLKTPQSVVTNANGTRLYVSDWNKGIVCLIREGDHLFTYTDSELKNPVGITRDRKGNIYTTGCNSYSINIMNENGVRIGELSTKPRISEGPRAIAYDDRYHRLLVSFGKDLQTGFDHIAVYR